MTASPPRVDRRRMLRALAIAALCAPLAALAIGAWRDTLGANPIETIEHETGVWGLRLLLASLAVTPLRRFAGASWLAPWRRTLGLSAFGYLTLHFLAWSVLDLGLDLSLVAGDVAKRPYVTVGFASFLLLVPLALTSTRASIRRLGRRWVTLHRLVYVAASGGVVHYLWLVKKDVRPPLAYAAVLAVLLAARVWRPRRTTGRAFP